MKFSKIKLIQEIFRNRSFIFKIPVFFRILKSVVMGKYRFRSKAKMILVLLILVYLISPLDFIPDWIPFLGIADDVGLFIFVLSKLSKEMEEFLLWETNEKST